MTILGGVTVLFLSLLFMALSLGILFAVLVTYCMVLEVVGVDPDSGLAFIGGLVFVIIPGITLIAYLFVSKYVFFMDHVLFSMGLTGL